MAEVVKWSEDGLSSVGQNIDEPVGVVVSDGTNEHLAESKLGDQDAESRPLSNEERHALLERERGRMADAAYLQTLEDPTEVIDALLRHHGRQAVAK